MTKRILILEDDLETLSKLLKGLAVLEEEIAQGTKLMDFAVTVLAEYTEAQKYANKKDADYFDLVLLDRDCKACGSFHILDIEKLGADKIISISSIPAYNEDAKKRGVIRSVLKEYQSLDTFTDQVMQEIKDVLGI